MEYSLLIILGVILLYVTFLYYIFIIKKEHDLLLRGRASIFILLFFITPMILIVFYFQSGAEDRLSKVGFEPYPGISSSVGIAAGTGENPIWLFSLDSDTDTVSIIKFYKNPENRKGWTLVFENKNMLLFKKDNEKMSVSADDEYIVFTLTH